MKMYEVRLTNTFEIESPEEAVRLMMEWIDTGYAAAWSYEVFELDDNGVKGTSIYIDGEDLDPISFFDYREKPDP